MNRLIHISSALLFGLGSLCATSAVSAAPVSGASFAMGTTGQGEMTFRAGLTRDWSQRWWQSDRGYLSGYWDAAYTYWEGSEASGTHALSFSPVLNYQFQSSGWKPFVELGLGVSFFSKTRVGEHQLGSSFNFENRLGAGLLLNNGSRIGIRALHYSNAGLKSPNDGIESYSLFYTHPF